MEANQAKQADANRAANEAGATLAERLVETAVASRPTGPANWTTHAFVPKHLCNWRQAPVSKVGRRRNIDISTTLAALRPGDRALSGDAGEWSPTFCFAVGGHNERTAPGAAATIVTGRDTQVYPCRC